MGYSIRIALHLDGFAMRLIFYGGVIYMTNKTRRLTESAMLLAVAIVCPPLTLPSVDNVSWGAAGPEKNEFARHSSILI